MRRISSFELAFLVALIAGIAGWMAHLNRTEVLKQRAETQRSERKAPVKPCAILTQANRKVCAHGSYDDDYQGYLRLAEGSAMRHFMRANAYAQRDQHERAIEEYNNALEISKDPRFYSHLADVYADLDDYESALQMVNEALKIQPRLYMSYADRSWYRHKLGAEEASKQDWSVYDGIQPQRYYEFNSLAGELFLRGRYDEALEAAERSLLLDPENGTFGVKGRVLAKQGQPEEALVWLTKGVKRHPKSVYYRKYRAEVLESLGRHAEAEDERAFIEGLKREVLD